MWNFMIRDGQIVQRAKGEWDNSSSNVKTHYDTYKYRTTFYLIAPILGEKYRKM